MILISGPMPSPIRPCLLLLLLPLFQHPSVNDCVHVYVYVCTCICGAIKARVIVTSCWMLDDVHADADADADAHATAAMQQYHSVQVKSGHFLLNIEHFVAKRTFSIAFHLMDRRVKSENEKLKWKSKKITRQQEMTEVVANLRSVHA